MKDFLNLYLYTRKDCCLCVGLEERLKCIELKRLNPPLTITIIDIDDESTPSRIKERYDLEVPVLILDNNLQGNLITLPRVSPRLKGEGLLSWLQKVSTKPNL